MSGREMENMKIYQANFCKNRFCPMCAWRQAKKDALRISILMEYIEQEHGKDFIYLTLTAPNVKGESLSEEITKYNKAFKNLMKLEMVKKINQGYIRKLEITYNENRGDYHPHFHCVITVNKSYFISRDYINKNRWLELWRGVMKDPAIKNIDVRKIKKDKNNKEINEIAKYAAKDSDYICSQNVFDEFYRALKGRQVMTYNGLFSDANKKYKAGDLDEYKKLDMREYYYMVLYRWSNGKYKEKNKREMTESERNKANKGHIEELEEK
jgi:plasmid rolling circle replication initiator protein Rep